MSSSDEEINNLRVRLHKLEKDRQSELAQSHLKKLKETQLKGLDHNLTRLHDDIVKKENKIEENKRDCGMENKIIRKTDMIPVLKILYDICSALSEKLSKLESEKSTDLPANHNIQSDDLPVNHNTQSDILNKLKQWCEIFAKQSHLVIFLVDRNESCSYSILNSNQVIQGPCKFDSKRKEFIYQISGCGNFIDTLYDDNDFIIYAVSRNNFLGKELYEIMKSIEKYVCG